MEEVIQKLIEKNKTISTMESCTGGLIANEITNISGASLVFKFGAVTYSNEYKMKLGVEKYILDEYTVYSMETAKEMSKKIALYTDSNYGIGITGKFNKKDPNNPFGRDNEVFISVYDQDNDTFYNQSVAIMDNERPKQKEFVYEEVLKILKQIIL